VTAPALFKVKHSSGFKRVFELGIKACLIASSAIAVLVTIGIIFSLIVQSLRFFADVSVFDFLFGLEWKPQSAIQVEGSITKGFFGAVPLFAGTFLISFIALCVAAPFGIFSAIYLSEYAGENKRAVIKPALEILAGVPTVVYGFFAAIVIAPYVRSIGAVFGIDVASEAAISAGIVMGIMIIPLVSSLADDVISAVPVSLKEGSIGLGATKSETVRQVILPAALPGIAGGMLLAASRAVGETMIVVMAAGLAAQLSFNPLEAVTTVTVQIVLALTGDQEFDSAKTLVAFALGLTLFVVTLTFNILGNWIVKRYKEAYE
jgi:phosphate transport system permease protein